MPHHYDWSYRKAEPTDEVKENLPDGYDFHIYEVTSGDTGKTYWVQLLMDKKTKTTFAHCNCNKGSFLWPLATLGIAQHFCKHIQELIAFRKNSE
jgi:hypothetical protein